jgi:signal peptidase I
LIKLSQFRLPGFSEVKKQNDAVVFNYPAELEYPLDLREYIKRCVAIHGDTLKVENVDLLSTAKKAFVPEGILQFSYYLLKQIKDSGQSI